MNFRPLPYNVPESWPDPHTPAPPSATRRFPPREPTNTAWAMDLSMHPPSGLLVGPSTTLPATWLIHILLWTSYFQQAVFSLQFPPLIAQAMTDIMHSFDDTTSRWPDVMDPHIIHAGEWTLNENFYVQQLSTLPLFSVTQLQAYNDGLIHAITNNLDPTLLQINGNLTSRSHFDEWTNQQSPCLLEFWRHWSLNSEEIVSQPPFLDTSDPDAANYAQHQPIALPLSQDIQHFSLGGAPVHTVQHILSQFNFYPSMQSMELPHILARMQLTLIPTPANGVVYNGFPPELFHDSRTASWFIACFFCKLPTGESLS